jgi:hypothetical protein
LKHTVSSGSVEVDSSRARACYVPTERDAFPVLILSVLSERNPPSLTCAVSSPARLSTAHPHVPAWPPDFSCDCSAFVAYFPLIVTDL